jgi:hypothetical protein
MTPCITDTEHNIALHYAWCHYAECRVLFFVMLNVVMLSVVMLSVVAPFTRLSCNLLGANSQKLARWFA